MLQRALLHFIGYRQITQLFCALRENTRESARPTVPWKAALVALLIGTLPAFAALLSQNEGALDDIDVQTVTVGLATLLAVALRVRYQIRYVVTSRLSRGLSLTHTSFALGCLPFIVILFLVPTESYTVVQESSAGSPLPAPTFGEAVRFVFLVSCWAALTEEWIYRALIIGFLRRIPAFTSQRSRDTTAVTVSALLFSLAHFHTWGLLLTIGLFGVGLGFGTAYIATKERLVPLMIYHFLFDVLSLSVALLRST
ncbi:CPBP family intramembrane metalloprotease [bacterium]|nr:CPBP family intramembrane metalloprotease [bacterium]